jgi:outer membrane cobalamin receptor
VNEIFIKGRWFDSRKDEDFSQKSVTLSSFETFDVGGVYRKEKHEFSVQIINIFDRDFEELFGFSVMPRSVFGAWSVKF